ncbi:SEC-C motif-containing protein [Corynebacterium felinum]|uniref:SEC-C motif-containing protein n=1 Tax=Corynebacterium felinum TaxID=131318 RepID=A0ABU2BAC8_9CORY|nr:YchJ family metal-binding protein [Corynebacterium felinum]MDR7355592.1 SEC-C motif-containing protein [Corynebacterium felinum]
MSRLSSDRCPCGSGMVFGSCCEPIIRRVKNAPTAQALMRSRFSAFCVGDCDYLLYSWAPETAPVDLELDEDLRWERLEILSTDEGGLFDQSGTVTFVAHYRARGSAGFQRECSSFRRHEGRWVYVDGEL